MMKNLKDGKKSSIMVKKEAKSPESSYKNPKVKSKKLQLPNIFKTKKFDKSVDFSNSETDLLANEPIATKKMQKEISKHNVNKELRNVSENLEQGSKKLKRKINSEESNKKQKTCGQKSIINESTKNLPQKKMKKDIEKIVKVEHEKSTDSPKKKVKKDLIKPFKLETKEQEKNVENSEIKKINKKKTESNIKSKETTSKLTIEELQLSVDKTQKAIEALRLLVKITKDKKELIDEEPPILLQVTSMKIPKVPTHLERITLPHALVSKTDDVALIVADLKKGRRRDYEPTILHYQDLLEKHNVTCINAVIPFNQLKTEYSQYEMKRKLFHLYDMFLVDGKIAGHVSHALGKYFTQKRKSPIPINMSKDFKEEIDKALRKTTIALNDKGNSNIIQVSNGKMSSEDIAENVQAVFKYLENDFPGGFKNIRHIQLKTPLSTSFPLYVSFANANAVKTPKIKPKRPKAYKVVGGELSTFKSKTSIFLTPEGNFRLKKIPDKDMQEIENLNDTHAKNTNIPKKTGRNKKVTKMPGSKKVGIKKSKTRVRKVEMKAKNKLKTKVKTKKSKLVKSS